MRVLILARETKDTASLQRLLRQNGIKTIRATTAKECAGYLERNLVKLILVVRDNDISLARLIEVRHLYLSQHDIPCFVLSASTHILDRMRAIEAGYNKYYEMPISYGVLMNDVAQAIYSVHSADLQQVLGPLTVNVCRRWVEFEGKYVELSRTQFTILTFLVLHPHQVFSRAQLWEHVWGFDEYPLSNVVDTHIRRLRVRLPQEVAACIQTVHGVGYRFVPTGRVV